MALSLSSYISQIVAGQGRKPGPIHDALQAIQNWASAGLTTNDLAANAGILGSQTEMGQYIAVTDWVTPTFFKNDNSTALSGTVRRAKYGRNGKEVTAEVYADGIGDPSGITIWMTLPIPADFNASYTIVAGFGENSNGTTAFISYALIGTTNGNHVAIRLGAENSWGAANNIINMKLKYFAAT